MVGDVPGYGTVWYDPRSIANILSLSRVKQNYHVQYNSSDGKFIKKTVSKEKSYPTVAVVIHSSVHAWR
jgi:hypothetical protein